LCSRPASWKRLGRHEGRRILVGRAPMKKIVIPGTSLQASRFSFGTASLHHLPSERERANLLAAAADAGFSHFDTAPYYGFGLAERSLAGVLRGNASLTVATKVGLYPPGGAEQSPLTVVGRKLMGKFIPVLSRPIAEWSVRLARASLDASLRRLGRPRVDLLLLHEPVAGLIDCDEWLAWLAQERDRVAHFGVAGPMARLSSFVDSRSALADVVQVADSLEQREANPVLAAGRPLQFTFGYLSAQRGRKGVHAATTSLQAALQRNATGSIIVSTRRVTRLPLYAAALADL